MNIISRVVNRYIKSLALILLAFVSFNSHAVVVAVTNNAAVGAGSFTAALTTVNAAGAGPHTINFTVAGPILAENFQVANTVTINGNGATIQGQVGGNNMTGPWNVSLMYINSNDVTINDLTISTSSNFGVIIDGGPNLGP